MAHLKSWIGLLALAADYLRIDLVGACVEQLDCLILELPHVAVVTQIGIVRVHALAWDQLRGFQPYCRGLCHH
jgi:hypothetical protein